MTDIAKYDKYYRDSPTACGLPFEEFNDFAIHADPGTVLDLGCGQGRDALMFARAGHRVVGIDISAVGINQMREVARAEGLDILGIVADICTYSPNERFDVVILDRVLHMVARPIRKHILEMAMQTVTPGGYLLVAEGPKGMTPVRVFVERKGWLLTRVTSKRLIAMCPKD